MQLPDEVAEGLKGQGVYEEYIAEHERNYYYLLKYDDTHYAYIHIIPCEGTPKPADELLTVDGLVKDAVITFNIGETE